jgi:hypothetical protein
LYKVFTFSINRFKDTPIYIERPDPSEEEVAMHTEDKPLNQKTLAELNLIDPFEFEVQNRFTFIIVEVTDAGFSNHRHHPSLH